MITRKAFVYKIQLQNMATGVLSEKMYSVFWDPEKIASHEVAQACRIEETVKHGFDETHQPRKPFLGLSAILQEPTTLKSKPA